MNKLMFWSGLIMIATEVLGAILFVTKDYLPAISPAQFVLGAILLVFNFTGLFLMVKGALQ